MFININDAGLSAAAEQCFCECSDPALLCASPASPGVMVFGDVFLIVGHLVSASVFEVAAFALILRFVSLMILYLGIFPQRCLALVLTRSRFQLQIPWRFISTLTVGFPCVSVFLQGCIVLLYASCGDKKPFCFRMG